MITHHSSCPQQRVLVIATMLNTNITTVPTNELTQVIHRHHNKGSTPYRLTQLIKQGRCALYSFRLAVLDQLGSKYILSPIAIARKSFISIDILKPAQCKAAELIIFNIPLV